MNWLFLMLSSATGNAIFIAQDKLLYNQKVNTHYTGLAQALLLLANGWALLLMLWLAADGVNGQAPDPMIALMAFATMASFELLMPIAGAFQYLGQTLTSARRLNEIILSEPTWFSPCHPLKHAEQLDIEFNQVSFATLTVQKNRC
ncbi:hypothetical protein [Vibrio metschnikovii]|uniref:hypothetical protein n=1 Tax=Vibrio metschnikovii TaxID=28172 RepID=UPI00165D99FD|nr:hypothetical protein [Vibrio metschnikovii]